MTRDELLAIHARLCALAREVMKAKNADYGADDDPFRNFREFGPFGIIVRKSDKAARLRGFVERGSLQVEDESIVDTALDDINYAVLLLAMLVEEGKVKLP